jgi:hypothetical protein
VDVTPVAPTGRTITVRAGGSVQNAINAAVPGDVILLQAGATFTGNFYLPKKSGTGWITIRSSASDGVLPKPGTRIQSSQAGYLPKLVSPNGSAALRTVAGAHHYRIVGVEITAKSSITSAVQLVSIGSGSASRQGTLASVPHHIVIDRSYIHGRSTLNLKNCVEAHGASVAIVDSYLARCHSKVQESHAIIGWNGPGPYRIENNRIEGAGINIMFGGADPASSDLMPADIVIRRNHVVKPKSWKDAWMVKSLLEFKLGRRVLVEGNVFENNWRDAQNGFAMNFKSTNQGGRAPFSETSDVTVRSNIIRNTAHGVSLAARPESYPAVPAARFRFENNVFERIGTGDYPGGRLFQIGGIDDLQLLHNTAVSSHTAMILTQGWAPMDRLVARDNVFAGTRYGISGDGAGSGTAALNTRAPGWVFAGNVVTGVRASAYPAGNFYPSTLGAVGFVSVSGGDYRLASSSAYDGRATDGTDPGADVTALRTLTSGVAQ